MKIYRKSNDFDIDEIAAAKPIGGWLIFLLAQELSPALCFYNKDIDAELEKSFGMAWKD